MHWSRAYRLRRHHHENPGRIDDTVPKIYRLIDLLYTITNTVVTLQVL